MSILRRYLAFTLILLILILPAVPVSAEAALNDIEICEKLGILIGDGDGLTPEYLESTPTRMQAAILFLRLKGLEAEALAYEGQYNFKDAEKVWPGGRAILAYLKVNPQLGWLGDGTGNFKPLDPIDAKEYAKVMLTALGYEQDVDFKWEDIETFAAEVGLDETLGTEDFKVKDLAACTVEALLTNVKGEDESLISLLVEKGIVSAQDAEAAGIYSPKPAPLGLELVTVPNLVQLKVVFNREVDEETASDEDNYTVEALHAKPDILVARLLDDGRTVILTLDKPLAQDEVLDLTVKNIKDINGSELEKAEYNGIECFDTKPPKVARVKAVDKNTIKIIFSEPVIADSKYLYEINGGEIAVEEVVSECNNTRFNLILPSELDEDKVSVRVSGNVRDYAGQNLKPVTLDVRMP